MNIPEQIGHYILEHQIGDGGSSVVWLAHHAVLTEHRVAFKFLKDRHPDNVRRFEREAAIGLRLNHPNIIQTYDYGQYEDLYYTMSEYISGSSLTQLIEKQGPIPFETALHIFRQIAAGLDYAHKHKVIHRDIAPKNILIAAESQRVVLIDFGIAREHHSVNSETGSFMGTPGFLSPEHFPNGQPLSHLSDIFTLGIVFYYMLSAAMPWEESGDEFPKVNFTRLISLRERKISNLPGSVDRVLLKMLDPEPARRYPTVQAAVDELDQIFAQHQKPTQTIAPKPTAATPTPLPFHVIGLEPSDVEIILGHSIVRGPLDKSRRHAETMANPQELARLLNAWVAHHPLRLRRPLLGRLARFHRVVHTNLYFYHLHLLYEQRSPAQAQERPDHKMEQFPVESELDRWKIDLPKPSGFQDEPGGQITIPGSIRVIKCATCKGQGTITCPRCKGSRRIMVSRPVVAPLRPPATPATASATPQASAPVRPPGSGVAAGGAPAAPPTLSPPMEQVPEPCPDCSGVGGTKCTKCQGARNLVQEKTFRWSRQRRYLSHHDDHEAVDFDWLVHTCAAEEIYRERHTDGLNPLWEKIQSIQPLINEAKQQVKKDENRIVLSELRIAFIPVTEVLFDLSESDRAHVYQVNIYGFENIIPDDWRLYNWGPITATGITAFALLLTLIMALFVFWLW
ncbi:protein kinase [Oscillochloris trichoides DG-6]|uniref:non-specific serine/threonine protein kinase n=1 Tax=Oscillochloris trichoides DG-6 TaxID=765420 RepID=E1IDG8_9CHLR|nr:serine/threonine-protein kinase [Oscillochloris trichoides]EFO80845.1 protein kinase [Oscillochloris trichoides DG-6]